MSRVAIRYAKAVYEFAQSNSEKVLQNMQTIAETLQNNEELRNFLSNPTISGDKKENVLLEVFKGFEKETQSLFKLLFTNKRFDILEAVAQKYQQHSDDLNHIISVEVTTAVALDENLKEKILSKAKEFTDKNIKLLAHIDASIIGGYILKIGDQQYNASVKNSLQKIKREIIVK
ncbi:MAG: ATP synthase F1 subunit delta [Flavobacterium sp.]